MKKVDLIALYAKATGKPRTLAADDLEQLGDIMAAELLAGGEVPLPGLGKVKATRRAARVGRNPRTGESLDIPAGLKVIFVSCKNLKEALKG